MLAKTQELCHKITANEGVGSTTHLPNQSRQRRAEMDISAHGAANEDSQATIREIWKHVPSEQGVLASSLGRILQAPSYGPMRNGGYRSYLPEPQYGQVAKASKDAAHEYRHVMLRRWGKGPRQQPRKVHQLVCEAFHGPKPFPNAVVIHLDENALNNRPGNLKWGTQKENLNMPKIKAYHRSRTGKKHPRYKAA